MSAISGTRRAMKEMADGTIRVQIDIDPRFRNEFFNLFGQIDMPVALAPLVSDFEKSTSSNGAVLDKPKGGPLARLAGLMCQSQEFREFHSFEDEEDAAHHIRFGCEIESRAELDHDPRAAAIFHECYRKPFLEWKEGRK